MTGLVKGGIGGDAWNAQEREEALQSGVGRCIEMVQHIV
jgi:hypothetical protein